MLHPTYSRALVLRWGVIACLFVLASSIQIAMYAPRLWNGGPIWGANGLNELGYTLLVIFFMLGPGSLATVLAIILLNRHYTSHSLPLPAKAAIAVFVLGLASSYLGVFICFNHWGT